MLAVQNLGNFVDGVGVGTGNDTFLINVAHQSDLCLEWLWNFTITPQDQRIWNDTDRSQGSY